MKQAKECIPAFPIDGDSGTGTNLLKIVVAVPFDPSLEMGTVKY